MSIEINGSKWTTWDDVRKEIFTPEEIAESDLRVASVARKEESSEREEHEQHQT